MVSSKCGRLLVAAGLPAAAAGLTLAAAGTAGAAPVAPPVVHMVQITTDISCDGHGATLAAQAHVPARTPEQTRPGIAPVVAVVHPVVHPVVMPEHIATHVVAHAPEQTRPESAPTAVTIRPVDCTQAHVPARAPEQPRPVTAPTAAQAVKVQQARPQHPVVQHGPAKLLGAEKQEGFKVQVVHQTVTLKIDTTAFTIAGQEGSEGSS